MEIDNFTIFMSGYILATSIIWFICGVICEKKLKTIEKYFTEKKLHDDYARWEDKRK